MYAQSCAHLHNPVHLRNPAQCRCMKVRRQAFPVNPDRFDGGAPQCRARCIRAACNSYVYVYTIQLNTILACISLYKPVYTYISLYKLIEACIISSIISIIVCIRTENQNHASLLVYMRCLFSLSSP